MVIVGGGFTVLHEQQWIDNVAEAAGHPHGDEQEHENSSKLPPFETGAYRHQDVKQGCPGADEHVAGVGEAGGGEEVADGDAGKRWRVGLYRLMDEADL